MIDQARLAESLGRLDAGTRALLDLSLRRAIPDDQVAKVLGVDATSIPPRRARGIAQLADMLEVPGPAELAALLIAIPDLPEDAWGVPAPVPFAGAVSRARRAKAFRRVAVAASPLVALGAVMAAVLVSADHSGGGPGSRAAQLVAAGAGAHAGARAAATAPDARHGLPAGVQLTLVHPGSARRASRAAHHHRAHRIPGTAEPAILARDRVESAPRSIPVAFHPAPVAHHEPRHVTHHHTPAKPHSPSKPHAPAKPHAPTSTAPSPVQEPSRPVSSPAPAPPASPPVQVSAPAAETFVSTPHKGSDGDDDDGGRCSSGHGSRRGNSSQAQTGGGKPWTPPGLLRKKHHGH